MTIKHSIINFLVVLLILTLFVIQVVFLLPSPYGDSVWFLKLTFNICRDNLFSASPIGTESRTTINHNWIQHGWVYQYLLAKFNLFCSLRGIFLFNYILIIITSLIGILVFTSATQAWFINRLRWYEIIIFLLISISLLAPEFVLNKFNPKYNYKDISQIHLIKFDPNKEARFKVTRPSNYGERYKLFVINKNTFQTEYSLEQYGISLIRENSRVIVDTLQWNGEAKKSGFENGDYISEFKLENADRPNKGIIYPIAILLLIIFGYLNSRRKE